jgi:hypothetical protein
MDEARAVLERLDRIEEATDRDELIAELRELVREVEAWVRAEAGLTGLLRGPGPTAATVAAPLIE